MKSPISPLSLLLASASFTSIYASSDSVTGDELAPCVARSSTTGLYYDLNALTVPPLPDDENARKNVREESWHAKGYDYNANFTLNICGPVVEDLAEVVGVDEGGRGNISAYYEKGGKTYSIGFVCSIRAWRSI